MQIDNIKLSIINRNATIGIIGLKYQGDILRSHASIEKASNEFRLQAKHDVIQGFKDTCKWYWGKLN
jgi:hypothetical protein